MIQPTAPGLQAWEKTNCITQSYINTHPREEERQSLRYHTGECKVHIWSRSSGMLCTRTRWLMEIDGVWHQIKRNMKYEKFNFHFIIIVLSLYFFI